MRPSNSQQLTIFGIRFSSCRNGSILGRNGSILGRSGSILGLQKAFTPNGSIIGKCSSARFEPSAVATPALPRTLYRAAILDRACTRHLRGAARCRSPARAIRNHGEMRIRAVAQFTGHRRRSFRQESCAGTQHFGVQAKRSRTACRCIAESVEG